MGTLKKYRCAECGEEFNSDREEEDARRECAENFGAVPEKVPGGVVEVCRDCFKKLMAAADDRGGGMRPPSPN